MKIYQGIQNFIRLNYAVVTSGTFDGVHIGHQKILRRLVEVSRREKGESVLITFWPHPRMVLNKNNGFLKLINTMEEKQEILREIGIDHFVIIPFTKEFAQTSSEDFIRKILVDAIGTRKLIIGYNHRFGKNREGSFESLKKNAPKYGFEVEEIPRHEIEHVAISSTKIRQALADGNVEKAMKFLGRPFSFKGIVIHGDELGRKIGFPTANLQIEETYKLIPSDGVYAVKAEFDGTIHSGMLSIGYRPTVNGKDRRIEVNIFDFNSEIYNKKIRIYLYKRIREEIAFDHIDQLIQAMKQDKEITLRLFRSNKFL